MAWDKDIKANERKHWKITRFYPDTCQCRILFAWDERTDETNRVTIPAKIEHACAAHAHLQKSGKSVEAFWDAVLHENIHKEQVVNHILAELAEDHIIKRESDGTEWREFKRRPKVSFNANRELVLELDKNITADEKRKLTASIKKNHGGRKTHLI